MSLHSMTFQVNVGARQIRIFHSFAACVMLDEHHVVFTWRFCNYEVLVGTICGESRSLWMLWDIPCSCVV